MIYFYEVENTDTDSEKEIGLLKEDRVFSIVKNDGGSITFREKCDGYFSASFTKEQAIELLQEAIAWIERA